VPEHSRLLVSVNLAYESQRLFGAAPRHDEVNAVRNIRENAEPQILNPL